MATHSSILCLENPMDRGSWWATVHRVGLQSTESDTTEATQHARTGASGHHCIPEEELEGVQLRAHLPHVPPPTQPAPPPAPHPCLVSSQGRAPLPQPARLMHAWAGTPARPVLLPGPSPTGAAPPNLYPFSLSCSLGSKRAKCLPQPPHTFTHPERWRAAARPPIPPSLSPTYQF